MERGYTKLLSDLSQFESSHFRWLGDFAMIYVGFFLVALWFETPM